MTHHHLMTLFLIALTGSLLACFGGGDEENNASSEPLTCTEASAEEVGAIFELDKSCTTDEDCTVIATGCDCPTPVNTSNKTDDYQAVRKVALDTCGDAYFEGCEDRTCAFDVDESTVVCMQGMCQAP